MLNSRQRAWLRARANQLESSFQIGKSDLTPSVIDDLSALLTTHELVKVHVLKSAETSAAQLAEAAAAAVGGNVVQVIGRRFVLYRFSEKLAKQQKNLQLPRI